MASELRFRDYQLDAIASVYRQFGLEPAGPEEDQIVAHCRGYGNGQDCDHGRAGEVVANGEGDDDEPPLRVESTVDRIVQPNLW